MEFRKKFKTSDQQFQGVLSLLDGILPDTHKVPRTLYMFEKEIGSSTVKVTEQLFCRAHRMYVGAAEDKAICAALLIRRIP